MLSRRVRRPALEQTIFHQLEELEHGPLEHLASLVHMVIDELRVGQRRLNEQARELWSLGRTVAELAARVDDLGRSAPAAPAAPEVHGHVLMLSTAAGYRLHEQEGPPPAAGEAVSVDGVRYRVLNRRASPFPGDARSCAFALPEAGAEAPRPEPGRLDGGGT